jgi:hypothetical protein
VNAVKKIVTPGVEVQKYLYKPLALSRDMKQKNVIGVKGDTAASFFGE